MRSNILRASAIGASLAMATALAAPALAQSRQITTPNVTTADTAATVSLGGDIFVNQGLVGAGRLDSGTRDFAGETLGSFSGMAFDLKSWHRNADGSYGGTLFTLPDRGPNDVGPFVGTTNYRNRVHINTITFRPYTGTAVLPQATTSQNQVTITPAGGFILNDTTGAYFTGKDALGGSVTRSGAQYPFVATGEGAGHISLDPEAIAFRPDGSFYISDEYAANIYYFDSTGKQLGGVNTIPAILPMIGGAVNFTGGAAPVTGRRNNQGLEALAITPDNSRLVTILQSATVQDTNGSSQQTRNNTRILVYDIATNALPSSEPIGHYVLQLPTFTQDGNGAAVNRTAAQSEMLALNNNQFLVLSRDGIGRGTTPSAASTAVFKSVLLVDITGATNLTNAPNEALYEDGLTPLATNGVLASGIVPAAQVELVNLLNVTQLGRFGMNLNTRPSSITSLSEKWEAMGLVPVLEEGAPQDFFLFVGNDNDFITGNGFINGQAYDASLSGIGGTGNNDSVLLVYRLTLPTYVDPQALSALNLAAPGTLYGTRIAAQALGTAASQPAMRFLNGQRGFAAPDGRKLQLWADAEWNEIGGFNGHIKGGSMGLDYRANDNVHLGVFGGYRELEGLLTAALPLKAQAWSFGAYAGFTAPAGIYGQASVAVLASGKLRNIGRASVYGQSATGATKTSGFAASGELGWNFGNDQLTYGPFVALDYADVKLNGYTETGASVSNLVFPDRKLRKLTTSLGAEVATRVGALRPALRGGYSIETESGDDSATVRLASAKHSMGTVNLPLADTERNTVFGELRLAMQQGPVSGYVSARGRWGRGDDDTRVSVGLGYAF